MSSVTIQNVGAIELVEIPIPDDGGVCLLRGKSGLGKSTALECVDALANGGKGPLVERRDGADAGEVRGFGAVVSVRKSIRKSGVLEVESLEGRLNLSEMIDPGIADPEKADARRAKAALRTMGVKNDPALFAPVAEAAKLDLSDLLRDAGDDIVEAAGKVKRHIEAEARHATQRADNAANGARAAREAAGGITGNETIPDANTLQAELEAAVRAEEALKTQAALAESRTRAATSAREQLEKAKAAYTGPTAAEARAKAEETSQTVKDTLAALTAAQQAHRAAEEADREARRAVQHAANHETSMAAWAKTIEEAAGALAPSSDEMVAAGAKVKDCRKAIESAAVARKALRDLDRAEAFDLEAEEQRERSEQLRAAAAKTDEVLSSVLAKLGCGITFRGGRLYAEGRRGQELIGKMSDGQRAVLSIRTVAPFLPQGSILTISQRTWGEIQPKEKLAIHRTAKELSLVILSAEVTDDEELTAQEYARN